MCGAAVCWDDRHQLYSATYLLDICPQISNISSQVFMCTLKKCIKTDE